MFKRTATSLDKQPTTKQQRLTCALKNTRLLPDGGFCLSDKGNEILFSNNISPQLIKRTLDWTGRAYALAS